MGIRQVLAYILAWLRSPFGHVYLSTGCRHHEHGYCQSHTGLSGAKTPASCKFCGAPCVCPCHKCPGEGQ
jgi:hypothetical protein